MARSIADHLAFLRSHLDEVSRELALLETLDLPTEAEVLTVTTSDFSRGFSEGYDKGLKDGKVEGYARAEGRFSRGRR